MNWKTILLASVLTTGLSSLALSEVQAQAVKTKDTTPPAIPNYKVNKYINLSNDGQFEIKGKGEKDSTIIISLKDGQTAISLKAKTDAKGNFKVKADTNKLTEGKITFSIHNVDKAGNKGKAAIRGLFKDVTLEEMSIDNVGFINAISQSEYPVSGTADLGSTIDVTLESGGVKVTGTGTVDELGNFSVDMDSSSLPDGDVNVTVKQTDVAGNIEEQSVEVVKDTAAPGNPVLFSPVALQSENVASYFVTGLGVANGEVEITLSDGLNDVSSLATVDENGLFQVELNAASLVDGEITIIAKQMSEAGNESGEAVVKTVKDTGAPVKPVVDKLAAIASTNQAEYVISGTGEKGAIVGVLLTDGTNTISASGVVDESGKFAVKVNVSALKAGNIIIIANQTDTYKNISTNTTLTTTKQ
jgi:hypothetical protein